MAPINFTPYKAPAYTPTPNAGATTAWLNSFLQEQQQVNAARDQQYNATIPNAALANQLQTRHTVGDILAAPTPNAVASPLKDVSGSPSILARALDILSRPLYGIANVATNMVQEAKGINPTQTDASAFGKGFTGKSKETYIDPLKATGMPSWLADTLGTVANIGLDPANLVGGTAGKAAVEGLKLLTGSSKAEKLADIFKDIKPEEKPMLTAPGTDPSVSGTPANLGQQLINNTNDVMTPTTAKPLELPAAASSPAFVAGPDGTLVHKLSQDVSKHSIDTAVAGVDRKSYNIGSISSPYQEFNDELKQMVATSRRDPGSAKAFAQRYKDILDPNDFAALQRMRSPQAFDDVAKNILSKTEPANFSTVGEFVDAAKHGEVPTDHVNNVLDSTYSNDLDHLLAKYKTAGGDPLKPIPESAKPDPAGMAQAAETPIAPETPASANPSPAAVRASAMDTAGVRDSGDAAANIVHDAKVNNVLQFKPNKTVSTKPQGQVLDAVAMRNLQQSERAGGMMSPGQQRAAAAVKTNEDHVIASKDFHEAGNQYETRAYEKNPDTQKYPVFQLGEGGPLIRPNSWDLGSADVMHVLGTSGIQQAVVGRSTRLGGEQLLRMGAAALDGQKAGLSTEQIQRFVEDTGRRHYSAAVHAAYTKTRKATNANVTLQQTAKLLANNVDRLAARVAGNVKTAHDAISVAAGSVVHEVETKIAHDISPVTGTTADAVNDLSNVGSMTTKAAKGHGPVADAAAPVVGEDVAGIVNEGDVRASKTTKANERAYTTMPKAKAERTVRANSFEQAKGDINDAKTQMLSVMPADLPLEDMRDIENANEINAIAEKKAHPVGSLLAQGGRKGRDIAQDAVNGLSSIVTKIQDFRNAAAKATKSFSPENIKVAFGALQSGVWPAVDSAAYEVTKVLRKLLDEAGADTSHMGGASGAPLTASMYGREYTVQDIHRYMKEEGMPKHQIVPSETDLQKLREANPGKTDREHLADWWRHTEVDDPVDFIGKLQAAGQHISAASAVAEHFGERYGSLVRKEGYVRIPAELSVPGGSRSWQYIPRVDRMGRPIYYPKEATEWFAHHENAVAAATKMTNARGPIAKFIKNDIDPIMSVWKTMLTVARPGYITRNSIGDVFMNFLVGVHSIKDYRDAWQIMKAGGHLKDRTIEEIHRISQGGVDLAPVGSWKGTVKLRGTSQVINDQAMYNLAYKHGVPINYRLSADVLDAQAAGRNLNLAQKFNNKVQSNFYIQGMGRVAEETSHVPRLAQFLHHMQDPKFTGKYRTLDEAAQAATTSVRKYHPDVTSLSASGQQVMRRIMPFYAWTRLATPVILEGLLTRPNSLTALPKFNYGVNELTGGDPTSIAEPFSSTRLLPNFVRDQVGYAGGPFTYMAGTPIESLEQSFPGSNMQDVMRGGVYSMLNPAIKAPIDLLSGTNQETGKGIVDKSDYIDNSLPFFGQIAQISGISPAGSINKIVTGQALIDPQRAVQTGEKQYFLNQSTLNFLSGLGINNFNRGSYSNIAASQFRTNG